MIRLNLRSLIHGRSTVCRGLAVLGLLLLQGGFRAGYAQPAATLETPPAVISMLDPTNGVGSWVWDEITADKQTCRFWKSFSIPPHSTVAKALLRITVDNGYRLFLDGREIGRGSDWRTLNEYDVTWLLHPGHHVLAVEAFNDRLQAGLILGLRIELVDQRVIEVPSDSSWLVVPLDDPPGWESRRLAASHWHPVKVIAAVGASPWNVWPIGRISMPALQPVVLHFWQQAWVQILLLSICGVAVAVCLQLMARLAVQSKAERVMHLERARIARDIHDDLGARLTQLVLLGEVARSELPADSQWQGQVTEICEKARDLSHAMDEVIWAVNSRRDTLKDFASYVCKYAQVFLASSPVRCRLDVEPEMPAESFALPIRRNLLLAVKEALNNAAKHSQARELFLRIHRQGGELTVAVEDDGRGFDPANADWNRNGMANMGQRMSEVGGRCQVTSSPGKGCRVSFTVPLTRESRLARWFARRKRPLAPSAVDVSVPSPATQRH